MLNIWNIALSCDFTDLPLIVQIKSADLNYKNYIRNSIKRLIWKPSNTGKNIASVVWSLAKRKIAVSNMWSVKFNHKRIDIWIFTNKVSSEINLYLLISWCMESLPEWVNKDWVENFEVSFTIQYKAFLFWAPEFLFQHKMLLWILIPNM